MTRTQNQHVHPRHSRRGSAMMFALVALFAASMVIGILLRTTALAHRQSKRDEDRAQARWLADAGLARAAAKLREKPDFTEETWSIAAEQLDSKKAAIVQIKVTRDPRQPDQRIVSAVSEFPAGRTDSFKVTRELRIP